jgi:twitching motility protein PilT
VVAREVMTNNSAISNLIRSNQIEQINSVIQTCKDEGMTTMNHSIEELLAEGLISEDVARNRKRDLETKAMFY